MERVTDLGFWMDPYLKSNLSTLLHNIKNDWDFMLLVSGDGMVRVGKSELAQQIGYYCAYHLKTPFSVDNVCFSGEELRTQAHQLPKHSVLIYDEARGEMDNKKLMEKITKGLLDFFAECGMYNHIIILVMPDYFEFPKSIAVNRSDALINVFRTRKDAKNEFGENVVEYERGHFQFFDRKHKKKLYTLGKKNYDDYDIVEPNFYGTFRQFDVIDKEAYHKKKVLYVQRDRKVADKDNQRFIACLHLLSNTYSQREIAKNLEVYGVKLTQARINQLLNHNREEIPREITL